MLTTIRNLLSSCNSMYIVYNYYFKMKEIQTILLTCTEYSQEIVTN